jgi:hypothetical protein
MKNVLIGLANNIKSHSNKIKVWVNSFKKQFRNYTNFGTR